MQTKKWMVADECNELAIARLRDTLSSLQYSIQDQWNGVAGSQDIHHWTAVGPSGQLII